MRRVFIFFTILCVAVVLAACTPTNDGRRTTEDERRTTKDEGRTTIVTATVTPVPTWTATPAPTTTPTATATPTRTLTAAEIRAASLPKLSGFSWKADGDSVKLYNAQNQAVAVLDQKTGAIRWHNSGDQKHFAAIEPYLGANYQNRKELAKWLSDLKAQGIHFITFADSREGFPPYIVIPTADGNDVQMISSKKGTADFVYNADAKKVMAVFPDKSGYYFVNPDGSFDLAPLQQQAEKIADDLLARGVIQHPDPAKAKFIRDAVAKAIMINPYGATPKEINDFIKSRTGRDFAEHFNRTWGDKLGLDYYELMNIVLAQSPQDLFALVKYIGNVQDSRCRSTCAVVDNDWRGTIQIVEGDHFPLYVVILKEAYGNTTMIKGVKILKYLGEYRSNPAILSHSAEAISLAIEAYVEYLQNQPDTDVNFLIDWAFKGGIVR